MPSDGTIGVPGPHQIPGIRGNCDNNTIVDPTTVDDLIAGWAL